MDLKKIVIDSLFPRRCPVCEEIVKGRYICRECLKKLSFVGEPYCLKCGKPLVNLQDEYCMDCVRLPKSFDFGMALLNYDDITENAMIKIKYKNRREYIEPYAMMMAERFRGKIEKMQIDCLMPVPVHKSRLRERGFNQAEILANILGRQWDILVDTETLYREKKTVAQKELTPQERLKNLTKAFGANQLREGVRNILLVDDIYTTGSTIEACTRVLRAKGAERIYYISICIGNGA